MQNVQTIEVAGDLPVYHVSSSQMGFGSSLGNGHAWATTGSDGRVLTLFSTDVGQPVAGPLLVRYAAQASGDRTTGHIPLTPDAPSRLEVHPAFQRRHLRLPGGIAVQETLCVPPAREGTAGDACLVYLTIDLHNVSQHHQHLQVFVFAGLAGQRHPAIVRGELDADAGTIFATCPSGTSGTRFLASLSGSTGLALVDDYATAYDSESLPDLNGPAQAEGDLIGGVQLTVELATDQPWRCRFVLGFDPGDRAAAHRLLEQVRDADRIMHNSARHQRQVLRDCQVSTPDPVLNEGCLWAKTNMLRVLAHYPQGLAFTNEPGVSSNVVVRDAAWFVYGCDHFRPDASRALLEALTRVQRADGKLPEYYNAITGQTEDYGLNIADATPLYVLAVNHHVRSTGDFGYLERVYNSVKRACQYLLTQRDERGLVYCTADGVETRGICSWRNVISNYQINGAVTEVNAQCAAALRAMGHMAENLDRADDAEHFTRAARELTAAIHQHLLDPQRQLYLLNIDTKGRRHTDVTADQVFPVLFRVAADEVAYRIIRRLTDPDFWTSAGLRTVSRLDPRYEPTADVGLMGGVWPGMTWWFAFAAARYHPELMVQGLHNSYAHYLRDPRLYHTVPGQFSEWFDGESLINRGMRLSPWEPPRFLWAAVEGVAGLMLTPDKPGLNPLRPADWKWTCAQRMWYHGRPISLFSVRIGEGFRAFSDVPFSANCPNDVYEREMSGQVHVGHAGLHAMALADPDRLLLAIGSCREEATTTPVDLGGLVEAKATYELQRLNSEYVQWTPPESTSGEACQLLRARIEARGYVLLQFKRVR